MCRADNPGARFPSADPCRSEPGQSWPGHLVSDRVVTDAHWFTCGRNCIVTTLPYGLPLGGRQRSHGKPSGAQRAHLITGLPSWA